MFLKQIHFYQSNVTNISYTVFLATLSTTLLSLFQSKGTVVNLSTSILSPAFKLARPDFTVNLDVSALLRFSIQLLLHN